MLHTGKSRLGYSVVYLLTPPRFQGGWHFLMGGINGLDNIDLADDDVENCIWFLGDLD